MKPEQVEFILQTHAESISLRRISQIGQRAYGIVVDIVFKVSHTVKLVHNEDVKDADCSQITTDEM